MICWTWLDRCVPGELPIWLLIWFGETIQNAQFILETDFLDHCLFPANSKTLLFFLLQYPIPTCSGRLDPITTYCDRKVALSPVAMLGLLVQDGFAITGGKPISRYFPLPVVWLQKGRETGGLQAALLLVREAFARLFPSQGELSKTRATKRNSPQAPAGRFNSGNKDSSIHIPGSVITGVLVLTYNRET